MTSASRFLPFLGCLLLASGCTLVSEYQIADGAKTERSYRTVAGDVRIGRDAAINTAKTVAGEIHVDDGASTRSLSTVDGEIRIGENANVDGDVSTVAGSISIDTGTHVTGKVSSIAGAIELNACRVDGAVRVTKGSLETRGATLLPGGITVHRAKSPDENDDDRPTKIEIGAGADVASIEIEPKADVDLNISREAHVGQITGATPTYY